MATILYETKKNDYSGRISELEAEISKTKYNKKTQHHIGMLKAKIAELKTKAATKKGGTTTGYTIKKTGDGTVALLGFPSVGKSTLLNAMTNAESKVGAYEFTTLDVIPGLLNYDGAKIQIFDVPGIVSGAADGSGRGKEVLAAIRVADLILIVIDMNKPEQYEKIMKEVYDVGIRLNQVPPDVKLKKTGMGGIDLSTTCKLTHLNHEIIKDMLRQMGIMNCEIIVREDITDDQLIDVVTGNRVYIKGITAINKMDIDEKKAEELKKKLKADVLISSQNKINMQELKDLIFERLGLVRIYMKEAGKEADLKEPLILRRPCLIRDICRKIHRGFESRFKTAKVWGSSKFPGQALGIDKEVHDKDIVEIHLK
ncbi:GTP-binding protein [Candidatus Woesearchaeota archaeon]|nr:GTP-binding protein [Candidatus Woesearchaeota archaeon]